MKQNKITPSNLKKLLQQTQFSFVYDENEDNNENEIVAIYFLSKKEDIVIHCTLITLIFEYQISLLGEAEDIFFAEHPEFKEKEYQDLPEKLQDEYDELMEDLHASGDIKVQEFIEEVDENVWEVCLNVESLDGQTIESFVQKYSQNKIQLDPNLYQFEIFEEE